MGILIIAGVFLLAIGSIILCYWPGARKTSAPPHFTSPSCGGMEGVKNAEGWWIVPLDYIEGWNEMSDAEKLAYHTQCERD